MPNHDLEGDDFSRNVGVYRPPKGAAVTFLVFAPTGKQFATSTPSDCGIHSLVFAWYYIAECEERHGVSAVERLLDACHALLPIATGGLLDCYLVEAK